MKNKDAEYLHQPFRYSRSRPFVGLLTQYMRTHLVPHSLLSGADMQTVTEVIERSYNLGLEQLPFERRPATIANLMWESCWAAYWLVWRVNGGHIFAFDEPLLAMLQQTDIIAVPVEALKLPYYSFYLSFGTLKSVTPFLGNYAIDGAYVSGSLEHGLQITITTIDNTSANTNGGTAWIEHAERYVYVHLKPKHGQSLEQLLAESIEDEAVELEQYGKLTGENAVDFEHLQAEARRTGIDLRSTHGQMSGQKLQELPDKLRILKIVLGLIANCLCYITAYRQDMRGQWSTHAPHDLLARLRKTKKPGDQKRIEREMYARGYSKIKFLHAPSYFSDEIRDGNGAHRAHWRRGHWRNQPHGPAREERKLIWIMPTVVGTKDAAMAIGHLYQVSSEI